MFCTWVLEFSRCKFQVQAVTPWKQRAQDVPLPVPVGGCVEQRKTPSHCPTSNLLRCVASANHYSQIMGQTQHRDKRLSRTFVRVLKVV